MHPVSRLTSTSFVSSKIANTLSINTPSFARQKNLKMVCMCHNAGTLQNNINTVVEEWIHGHFCLRYFSSSTHFYLVKGLARKVWRQCVRVFAHDLGYRGGNCNGLHANTGLFLSTGNRYLFLLQRRLIPFRLFTTAPESILPCLASKFRKRSF